MFPLPLVFHPSLPLSELLLNFKGRLVEFCAKLREKSVSLFGT